MTDEEILPLPTLFSEDELDAALYPAPVPYDPLAVIGKQYPRIQERIRLLWGSIELYNYLNNIILDDRHYATGQMRQGFDHDTLQALLHIHKQHSILAGVIEHIPVSDKWFNCK